MMLTIARAVSSYEVSDHRDCMYLPAAGFTGVRSLGRPMATAETKTMCDVNDAYMSQLVRQYKRARFSR